MKAQIYEDCNLLEHAAKCYERLGKVDKMTLYLLGEGKEHEAVALYEKAGRTAKAKWVNKVAKFHLATFKHPLRRLQDLTPDRRIDIFSRVGDEYHAILEAIRFGQKPDIFRPDRCLENMPKLDSKRPDYQDSDRALAGWLFGPILPIEAELLFRAAGTGPRGT